MVSINNKTELMGWFGELKRHLPLSSGDLSLIPEASTEAHMHYTCTHTCTHIYNKCKTGFKERIEDRTCQYTQ